LTDVDKERKASYAAKLAKMLGCRVVLEQIPPAPLVDASYIVGSDRVKEFVRARS
jgi:hypothetical protein